MKKWTLCFLLFAILIVLLLCYVFPVRTTVAKRIDNVDTDVRCYIRNGVSHGGISGWTAWWSAHHSYTVDNVRICTADGQYLSPISDFWLFPDEVEELARTYTVVQCDCEDGAIDGTADLIADGLPAWCCVGYLRVNGVWYGHVWIECNGQLIETTTSPAVVVSGRPDFYRLAFKFNNDFVIRGSDVAAPENIAPLPDKLVKTLLAMLNQ